MHGGIKRNECDMELLMTPAEVVEAAFGGGDVIDAAIVTESAVLTAQRRYLRPVFGVSFYGALEQGRGRSPTESLGCGMLSAEEGAECRN